jgi:hypothetical protein
MPEEVWGTFSVADHLRDHAFIADVLLYDRLVIPVPPPRDAKQEEEWHKNGWDPDGLAEMIERMTRANPDLVWQIPWDEPRRKQFESRHITARAVADDTRRLAEAQKVNPDGRAFGITREILYEYARDPANGPDLPKDVWPDPMPAYPSYHAFVRDVPIDNRGEPKGDEKTLAGVFGWQFFAPDEPQMDHLDLLEAVAQFAKAQDFRDNRREFHNQRRELIRRGVPDEKAVAEMNRLTAQYAEATGKIKLRTRAVNGFTVSGIAAGVAGALAGLFDVPVAGPVLGLTGAFFTACRFGADQWLAAPALRPEQQAMAMVHDTRNWFARKAKNR